MYPKNIGLYVNAMKTSIVIFKNGIDFNILEEVQEIKAPIMLISGKHDVSTLLVLVEKFYKNILDQINSLLFLSIQPICYNLKNTNCLMKL